MTTIDANSSQNTADGLVDVVRSVRSLARTSRTLGEDTANIMERELAMAISISERIRNDVVSDQALEEARKEPLPARLRDDAHRVLDLVADAGSLLYVNSIKFFEVLTDEQRPVAASNKTVLTRKSRS